MRKSFTLGLLFVVLSLFCRGQEGQPLLAVRSMAPWTQVVCSHNPWFILYADGTVVCLREKPTMEDPYFFTQLPEVQAWVKENLPGDLSGYDDYYEVTSFTDQMDTTIWTPQKRIRVYGDWRRPPEMPHDLVPNREQVYEKRLAQFNALPVEIRQLLDSLDAIRREGGDAWLPPTVEVLFWPYKHPEGVAINWPESWPGLDAPTTRKGRKGSYAVTLPIDQLPALRSFMATRPYQGAVLIDGQSMGMAFLYPLPGEAFWRHWQRDE